MGQKASNKSGNPKRGSYNTHERFAQTSVKKKKRKRVKSKQTVAQKAKNTRAAHALRLWGQFAFNTQFGSPRKKGKPAHFNKRPFFGKEWRPRG